MSEFFLITAEDGAVPIAAVPDVDTAASVGQQLEDRAERRGGPRYSWINVPLLPSATSKAALTRLVREVEERAEDLFEEGK